MAENSKDELNNKREQSKVEKEINEILNAREQAYKSNVQSAGDTLDLTRQITEDIKDQLGMTRAKAEADTGALSLARKLQQSAQQVTSELGNQGKIQRQLINDQNLLSSIRTEISIIDGKIGEEGAAAASDIANALFEQQDLQKQIEESRQEMSYLDEESKKYHQEHLDMLLDQVTQLDNQIKKAEELSDSFDRGDIRRLVQLKQQETLGEKLISQREDELETQRRIEDRTGVTGALVEGVGGIMQRLGMRSGIFQNAMEKAAEEMQKMAEESERVDENGEAIGKQYSKTAIAIKGLTELTKGFGKALGDPLTITLAIADAFFKVDAAASKLQQTTGQNSNVAAGLNMRLASTVDVLEVMTELTAQTGMNAQNIFSPDVLAGAAELKNTMGLSAEAAGGLAKIAQTTVGSIHGVTDSVVGTVSAFNKANRSAVSQGVVLNDVANAADDIKASFAGNPELLAEAASAARKIGLELSRVDQIASSLMDFESSIEAELEAQLLTGKSINMAKARELALNNDIAGLTEELFKNSADIADFGKMNRIQQEAQAKALGVSREELGRMAYQAALNAGLTEDQAAAAANVKAEDMQRMAVQDKLAKAAEKMTQAFAPMLDILIPVADLIGFIAKIITYPVSKLMELGEGIKSMNKDAPILMGILGDGFKLIAGLGVLASLNAFKNFLSGKGMKFDLFSKIKEKALGAKDKIKDVTSSTMDKGAGATGKMQQKTKGAKGGKGVKSFLKGLGDGLASIGKQFGQIIKGALALGIAGVAIGGSFALALRLVKDVDPLQMVAFSASIALFGGALALLGKMSSQVIQGSIAMGILSLAAMGFATAFSMLENVDTNKMIAFSIAVPLLGLAAAGLGFLAPAIGLGALAIGALGLSLIPLAGAFALLGAVNVEEVLGSLSSFASMTPGLLLAGPALLGLAGGLLAFSAAMAGGSLVSGLTGLLGGGVLADLQTLAGMAQPLSGVATSLTAIAAGLAGIALALSTLETEKINEIKDLVMTTALAAPMIAASGAITSLINGITGGGEGDSNSELLAEIKALRAAVEAGGDVFIDGNKAGSLISMASNKGL